jgi:murein DD-endopeptidase MepM/ murein hydrolase activator NlpD
VLASAALAAAVALGLATLAPSPSTGASRSVEADAVGLSPATGSPRYTALAQLGAVDAAVSRSSGGGQRDQRGFQLVPAAPSSLTGYRWPLLHGRITLPFGPWRDGTRIVDGQAFHDGVDLATFCGDRIVAAHDGVVLAAGRHYDDQMGWIGDLAVYYRRLDEKSLWMTLPIVVVVDDGNGYRSLYAHLGKLVVQRGDAVHAGQLLGYEGQTGHATGCHLHYGLFSPEDSARFGIDPEVADHMQLPPWEIARIDPLLVLPSRDQREVTLPLSSRPRALRGDDGSY